MRAFWILFISALLALNTGFAQKILFQDNFDSYLNYSFGNKWTTNPSWKPGIMYLVVGSADTACLCNEAPDAVSNQRVAGLSDCAKSPINYQTHPNELLYTSTINLVGINNAWLSYESYFKKGNYLGSYEEGYVEISINGGLNWTVLQNVQRNNSMSSMQKSFLNITPYCGNADVRIGFRFKDNGQQIGGWAIDNVQVFQPIPKDLKLISVTPEDTIKSYTAINTGYKHTYTIQNMGIDTVTDFVVAYRQGNGKVVSDSVKNVSIPPFAYYTHTHGIPDTLTAMSTQPVTAWVQLNNDTIHDNDTIYTALRGTYFLPKKMVAVEEGTGTWHFLSPRGLVYMQQLSGADLNVCQIAVHDTDPMTIEPYSDYLYNIRQIFTPYFLIDRHILVTPDSLIEIVTKEQTDFGFADLKPSSYTYEDKVLVTAIVKPAVTMIGDYRLLLVVTENKVSGTSGGWEQVNGYSDNKRGPMGGYENKPDPIPAADMEYNFVARSINPIPDGLTNLPHTLYANQEYSISFESKINPKWNKNNMYASVLLLRNDDTTILNAARIPFALAIKNYKIPNTFNTMLYPNPANEQTNLQLYCAEETKLSMMVTDISGRKLLNYPEQAYHIGKNEITIPTTGLASGIYIISINGASARQSLKLEVLH
jgi:hypothetical protein